MKVIQAHVGCAGEAARQSGHLAAQRPRAPAPIHYLRNPGRMEPVAVRARDAAGAAWPANPE